MIGDIINFKEQYLKTSTQILDHIGVLWDSNLDKKIVVGISGESGSGKSVTAFCLQYLLEKENIHSYIFHMDDYFIHPPLSNHQLRLNNIELTGKSEVNLDLLKQNILQFKQNITPIAKPMVYYKEDTIGEEVVDMSQTNILIVEGTYVLDLDLFDYGIFMSRNYIETRENRRERARDVMTDFVEEVLKREHNIIKELKHKANFIVNKDYSVSLNQKI